MKCSLLRPEVEEEVLLALSFLDDVSGVGHEAQPLVFNLAWFGTMEELCFYIYQYILSYTLKHDF